MWKNQPTNHKTNSVRYNILVVNSELVPIDRIVNFWSCGSWNHAKVSFSNKIHRVLYFFHLLIFRSLALPRFVTHFGALNAPLLDTTRLWTNQLASLAWIKIFLANVILQRKVVKMNKIHQVELMYAKRTQSPRVYRRHRTNFTINDQSQVLGKF